MAEPIKLRLGVHSLAVEVIGGGRQTKAAARSSM
jgi:hypothetical protein